MSEGEHRQSKPAAYLVGGDDDICHDVDSTKGGLSLYSSALGDRFILTKVGIRSV